MFAEKKQNMMVHFFPPLGLTAIQASIKYAMDEPYRTALGMVTRARKLKLY
jgi:hypothetical protein